MKLTFLPFLLKACVSALQEFPHFNASLDHTGENLILKRYYHVGVAVDTTNGLVVPVVRDVDRKGLLEIAAELAELSARARGAQAHARRSPGRLVQHLEPRRHRRHLLHADREPARGRDPRRRPDGLAAGVPDGAFVPRLDAAALALLRPPRDRRRRRRALHHPPVAAAVRPAPADPVAADGRRRDPRRRARARRRTRRLHRRVPRRRPRARVVLVERYPALGGVCLNVGCIPSKALLHVAEVIAEAGDARRAGVAFGAPTLRPRRSCARTRTRS